MSDFFKDPEPVPQYDQAQPMTAPVAKVEISDRALQAGNAMIDANDAFNYAGVRPTAEDIRSLAITFLIGEGKDNRTAKIGEQRNYRPAPRPAPQAPTNPTPAPRAASPAPTGGKLSWLSPEFDVPVTLTVISDDGEFQGKFGVNHGFTVEVDGAQYKYSTTSKAILPKMLVGTTITIKKYKNAENQTRYEVK